jgi:sugar lactone lactonase YvrE
MTMTVVAFAAVFFMTMVFPSAAQETSRAVQEEKGGNDETGPYEVVPNWPKPLHGSKPGDWSWGRTAAIFAESPDRVFVLQSGELPILERPVLPGGLPARAAASMQTGPDSPRVGQGRWEHILMIFNRDGDLIDSWEQHNALFVRPHAIRISPYDPERHVWVVEDGAHSIYKFTNDGKRRVMTLGEFKVPGNDRSHFNRPTDIAFFPNGDFLVSDGYVNTRVVKFDKNGKYLTEWGKPNPEGQSGQYLAPTLGGPPFSDRVPFELNTVHGVAIDAMQRVYVSDRGNRRIQVFDANGKHLDTWPNIRFPLSMRISKDQHLWVNDGDVGRFLKFNLDGKLLATWGTFGAQPGMLWGVHAFSTDQEGNVYTAEVWGGRAQKFRPKKNGDPSRLIGPLSDTLK